MSGRPLPTTSYAVLGLVSLGPRSGYETVRLADQSISNFWTIAKSQVYKELERLEALRFVHGTDVRQERRPDKRTYRITAAGRKALVDWLNSSPYEPDRIRSAFCVKVFFGHLVDQKLLSTMVAGHGESAAKHREAFRPLTAQLESSPQTFHMYATALLGQRILETIEIWSNDVIALMKRNPPSPTKRGTK